MPRLLPLLLALALAACAPDRDPEPAAPPDVAEERVPDVAPETRIATEAELVGAYDCQLGPGRIVFARDGDARRFTAEHAEDGTWALADGRLTILSGAETLVFDDLHTEEGVLTLSTGRDEPGSTWVCARAEQGDGPAAGA